MQQTFSAGHLEGVVCREGVITDYHRLGNYLKMMIKHNCPKPPLIQRMSQWLLFSLGIHLPSGKCIHSLIQKIVPEQLLTELSGTCWGRENNLIPSTALKQLLAVRDNWIGEADKADPQLSCFWWDPLLYLFFTFSQDKASLKTLISSEENENFLLLY